MKRMMFVLVGLMVAVGFSAAACAWLPGYPSAKIRYKMTVEVDTPEGIKAGFAVREISMVSRPMLLGVSNDTHVKLEKGEAVVVDLGQRGVLFATLGSATDSVWTLLNAFPSPCAEGAVSRCSVKYYSSLKVGEKAQLPARYYPMFVAFEDLNDPKSAKNVLEMKSCPDPATGIPNNSRCVEKDRFEEIFGQGVRLRSVTVEVTDADVETVVQRILPWLPDYYDKRLDGQRFGSSDAEYKFANRLSSGAFSSGVKK
ncbi:MAG: hypothetical protein Q8K65_09260 [Alphaproteobacteria bacterium]|nr:hypothetical protein [Alphaproteobacteria bacterium]